MSKLSSSNICPGAPPVCLERSTWPAASCVNLRPSRDKKTKKKRPHLRQLSCTNETGYDCASGNFYGQEIEMDAPVKPKKPQAGATSKREKFVHLAQSRTVNAIRAIRVIGKLGNKSHYDYTDADVKKIVGALSKELEALKARMSDQGGKAEVEFKL